jgi:hypothetical protein
MVRIPLDYYRILGLPIQATSDQLEQAHRDRILQLPRREYSELAVQARKQLIDEAFSVLSDVVQRKHYDDQFLTDPYATTAADSARRLRSGAKPADKQESPYNPTIDVTDRQLIGALLLLLELGEYELVIRLAQPLIGNAKPDQEPLGDLQAELPDISLTLALACLELGRERWQQHQYEKAAESLETGREILFRENLFSALRSEIQSDLYRLRPYRILELVARPLEDKAARQQGIVLLKAMLNARSGIDGADDDLSGLGVEDFLRFTQQLRVYLTAAEQQEIFEAEAQRPSAVGTYLAVYALIARGFARHQPVLVRRAKQLLMRLGNRQDIHLEQAVCAVLLGQTEAASRALERSQERDSLRFIQEHSQGSPDLLPGLCLYAERWLQQDVFPFFRDLDQHPATLKDYFADEQVQAYLETMPTDTTPEPPGDWPQARPGGADAAVPPLNLTPNSAPHLSPADHFAADSNRQPEELDWLSDPQLGTVGRVAQLSPEGRLQGRSEALDRTEPPPHSRGRRLRRSPKWGRLSLVGLLALLCVGAVGLVTMRLVGWLSGLLSGPRLTGEVLSIGLSQPAVELSTTGQSVTPVGAAETIASDTLKAWFEAKAAAFGTEHEIDQLRQILTEPALSLWVKLANEAKDDNRYGEYQHALEILSVEPDDPQATALVVTAKVGETANFYRAGVRDQEASYDDQLEMRYDLVRRDDRWLIKSFRQNN